MRKQWEIIEILKNRGSALQVCLRNLQAALIV